METGPSDIRLLLLVTRSEADATDARRYANRVPSRAEAIRRLIEIGLIPDKFRPIANAAVFVLMLYGITVATATKSYADDYLAGGPYFIKGEGILGCRDEKSAFYLSQPNAERRLGRVTFMRAVLAAGCQDFPDGTKVNVTAAGDHVAMVVPDVRGLTAYRIVPVEAVVDAAGTQVRKGSVPTKVIGR